MIGPVLRVYSVKYPVYQLNQANQTYYCLAIRPVKTTTQADPTTDNSNESKVLLKQHRTSAACPVNI